MPRTTREWAKRKLKEANNNLDWIWTHLSAVIEVYDKEHPELTQGLKIVPEILTAVQDIISKTDSRI